MLTLVLMVGDATRSGSRSFATEMRLWPRQLSAAASLTTGFVLLFSVGAAAAMIGAVGGYFIAMSLVGDLRKVR